MRILYITSSSYSGSTLLAFLLNTHAAIATVGEMDGWHYGEDELFFCSCGNTLDTCSFFRMMAEAFRQQGLPFAPRRFGTDYRVVENDRLNRYLTGALPAILHRPSLERLRDAVVGRIPAFAQRLEQQDRANLTFIRTALAYKQANVFVDACKSPYRVRRLHRFGELDIRVLYLVRDLRGFVLSNLEMNKAGWDAAVATRVWIRQQAAILHIVNEFPAVFRVYYEELCDAVDQALQAIYRFLDLEPTPFAGDFKAVEHHILGNTMRLSDVSQVVKSRRWQHALSAEDLEVISRTAFAFVRRHKQHAVSRLIQHYLAQDAPWG